MLNALVMLLSLSKRVLQITRAWDPTEGGLPEAAPGKITLPFAAFIGKQRVEQTTNFREARILTPTSSRQAELKQNLHRAAPTILKIPSRSPGWHGSHLPDLAHPVLRATQRVRKQALSEATRSKEPMPRSTRGIDIIEQPVGNVPGLACQNRLGPCLISFK